VLDLGPYLLGREEVLSATRPWRAREAEISDPDPPRLPELPELDLANRLGAEVALPETRTAPAGVGCRFTAGGRVFELSETPNSAVSVASTPSALAPEFAVREALGDGPGLVREP